MFKLIYHVLTESIVYLDSKFESLMIEFGMSSRSIDYLLMLLGGILLLATLCIIIGLFLTYLMIIRLSYIRMTTLKTERLRRKWANVFTVTLIMTILEIIILFM